MARFSYTTAREFPFWGAYIWDAQGGLAELENSRRFLTFRRCHRWARDERHRLEREAWGERIRRDLQDPIARPITPNTQPWWAEGSYYSPNE